MRYCILLLFCSVCISKAYSQNKITLSSGDEVFLSGINVAWVNFGGDVADSPLNEAYWINMLDGVKNAGGNCVRWWLYLNASQSPKFDANGYVSGMGTQTVNNVNKALDLAHERGMVIILCLYSFDLLQNQTGVNLANNKKMLNTDEGISACINNSIVPLVTAVGNHPGIACWEIFNEPEGMTTNYGWSTERVTMFDIQRFVNRASGAIHRAVPEVLVSNGAWNFKVLSNTIGFNYYSDSELFDAGGDADGYLDFYMIHYYNNDGGDNMQHSPFHHDKSYWGLDKEIVVAEFSAKGFDNPYLTPTDCYREAYERNYAGVLSWTYTNHDGHGGLPDASAGISYLYNTYPDAVTISPATGTPFDCTNLALGKEVSLSSIESSNSNIPEYINDGDYTSRWSSDNSSSQMVTIDLEEAYIISDIALVWSDTFAIEYSIEISEDSLNWATVFVENSGDGENDIISIDQIAAKYIRLNSTSNNSGNGCSLIEFEVYAANLALSKPVTVSSTEADYGNVSANAVDGNMSTRWSSDYDDPQWIEVDLEAIYRLFELEITWENAYASEYMVLTSIDNVHWDTVFVTTEGNGGNESIPLSNTASRFVKIEGLTRATEYGYSIFEIEAYGIKYENNILVQSINLEAGWNFISTNLHPIDSSVVSIFSGIDVQEIKTADSFWSSLMPDYLISLNHIEAGKGYLVKTNTIGTLYISGSPVSTSSYNYHITNGWQMIGVPFQEQMNMSSLFNNTNCQTIKDFNGFWTPNGTMNSIESLRPGHGYFLNY